MLDIRNNFLFTEEEYNNATSRDLLPLKCVQCGLTFYKEKHYINSCKSNKFCNPKCAGKYRTYHDRTTVVCLQCGKVFSKRNNQIKNGRNNFCSNSCHATYQNAHKLTGYRRSKIEEYLEKVITEKYPNLEVVYNDRTTLGGLELDIYIPSLKLAFELNGIFHYIPVFGATEEDKKSKFSKIQSKDIQKLKLCQEKGIEVCVIDISNLKRFYEKAAQPYAQIVFDTLALFL